MPELPEVETTRRGITPYLTQQSLAAAEVRQAKLRYPVPETLLQQLCGDQLHAISRRSKYLLLDFTQHTLIVHLGMSGSLRVLTQEEAWRQHDHWQLTFANHVQLRYNDPRRFGFMVSSSSNQTHPLIQHLGVEPLSDHFTVDYLLAETRQRKIPIKSLIMNAKVVVGIGNIYASEALFAANIHPLRPANTLNATEVARLHQSIQHILQRAIEQGGTTLKDFINPAGQPGYFAQQLNVYGKTNHHCLQCNTRIEKTIIAGRSSFFCPQCQPEDNKQAH